MAPPAINDFPPLFLIPAVSDVRSRRHIVVIHRAEAHIQAVVDFLQPNLGHIGSESMMREQLVFVREKAKLVQQAVDELELYISCRPRSRIAPRLEEVKVQLGMIMQAFERYEK
jgi:hypothetical protein